MFLSNISKQTRKQTQLSQVSQINSCHSDSQVTSRSTDLERALRFYSFSSRKVCYSLSPPPLSTNHTVCRTMFARCGAYPFKVFFFFRRGMEETCSVNSIQPDVLRAFFTHSHPVRLKQFVRFSLSLFLRAAVICCDKAASTGDARVSRVEGHPPPFPARALSSPEPRPSRSRPVGGAYDIFVITLPAIRALPLQLPLVTNGREPFFFHFTTVYILAHSPTPFRINTFRMCAFYMRFKILEIVAYACNLNSYVINNREKSIFYYIIQESYNIRLLKFC